MLCLLAGTLTQACAQDMVALYSQGTVQQSCNDALTEGSFSSSRVRAHSMRVPCSWSPKLHHSWLGYFVTAGVVGIVQSQRGCCSVHACWFRRACVMRSWRRGWHVQMPACAYAPGQGPTVLNCENKDHSSARCLAALTRVVFLLPRVVLALVVFSFFCLAALSQ